MEKVFSVFGKIMLVLIVFGSLTYGGYYFGTQTKSVTKPEAVKTEVIEPTPTAVTQPQITTQPLLTVIGGLEKSAGLSFEKYTLNTPTGWLSKKESQTTTDEKLTLTKDLPAQSDGYTITIFQAATGGSVCLYPGDAEFEGPSSKFDSFTPLTTLDGKVLRRSGNKGGTTFTICQKSIDNSYQQPTNYGHISIKLPGNYTAEMLLEIDQIISSLKKI